MSSSQCSILLVGQPVAVWTTINVEEEQNSGAPIFTPSEGLYRDCVSDSSGGFRQIEDVRTRSVARGPVIQEVDEDGDEDGGEDGWDADEDDDVNDFPNVSIIPEDQVDENDSDDETRGMRHPPINFAVIPQSQYSHEPVDHEPTIADYLDAVSHLRSQQKEPRKFYKAAEPNWRTQVGNPNVKEESKRTPLLRMPVGAKVKKTKFSTAQLKRQNRNNKYAKYSPQIKKPNVRYVPLPPQPTINPIVSMPKPLPKVKRRAPKPVYHAPAAVTEIWDNSFVDEALPPPPPRREYRTPLPAQHIYEQQVAIHKKQDQIALQRARAISLQKLMGQA